MSDLRDFSDDELKEILGYNNIGLKNEFSDLTFDEFNEINNNNPIGDYESLSDRMKEKIKKILDSMDEKKLKELKDESDDRDEKDTLDEKDGKEELDEDKKEEVEEKEDKEKEKDEVKEENEEGNNKDEENKEIEEDTKEKEEKEEENSGRSEYLNNLEKLHKMRMVELKDELKHDNPHEDRYFINMLYLQRKINRERNAFVKEYGNEELKQLENKYLREELKYQKQLDKNMQKDLNNLAALEEKLDEILDKMQVLKDRLEDKNIDLAEYNDEVNSLEKEKLETLWQINKLNPTLLQEKQENIKQMKKDERYIAGNNINKKRDISEENRDKLSRSEYLGKKQDGMAEKYNEDMKDNLQNDVDEKEKRLDNLRKELNGVDIESADGKKRALDIISEIQTLETQKMSEEKQIDNLDSNMQSNTKSYADLEDSENKREDDTKEIEKMKKDINTSEVSDDLMEQLRSAAMSDPNTPEQAEEYLDNIKEAEEDVKEENDINEESKEEEEYVPSLFNRKRPGQF